MPTYGGLFEGIGGWSKALDACGACPAWQCEIEPYCREVLDLRWPGVARPADVRELDGGTPRVDILAGGFPCQDLSYAGRGAGLFGERSGLWFEYARLIGELRPTVAFIENVPALLRRGMGWLLAGLRELGYDAEWDGVPAAAVGAPHLRDRIWIVAYRAGTTAEAVGFGDPTGLMPIAHLDHGGGDRRWPRAGMLRGGDVWELMPSATVSTSRAGAVLVPTPTARDHKDTGANTDYDALAARSKLAGVVHVAERDGRWLTPQARDETIQTPGAGSLNPTWVEWLMGFPVGHSDLGCADPCVIGWDAEPLPRTVTGLRRRVPRIKALGNALVPQVAERVARPALRALLDIAP